MPKLENLRKILIVFLIILLLFSLTGCDKGKDDEKNNKIEKVNQEIIYLDGKIIAMLNKLNNISFSNYKVVSEEAKEESSEASSNEKNMSNDMQGSSSDKQNSSQDENSASNKKEESSNKQNSTSDEENSTQNNQSSKDSSDSLIFKMTQDLILNEENGQDNKIEWEEIRKDIENIYTIWPTISLDLSNLGINNTEIVEFNNILDNIAIDSKNKNKETMLVNLSKMYSLLPKYMEVYLDDDLTKNVIVTKSFIINVYVLVNLEKWDEVDKNLKMADDTFFKIIQNKSDYIEKELNINRSNSLIGDLKNSIKLKEKKIFFLRYKNLMQELNLVCY